MAAESYDVLILGSGSPPTRRRCRSGPWYSARGLAALATVALSWACGGAVPEPEVERPGSLLLVTIDTLRADRVGCYGHAAAATPVMDRLAARGVRFAEANSVAPMTFPAHTSLMTGTIPPQHGARDNGGHRALPELETLAEVLRAAGRRTGAFVAAFVLDSIFGLDQGFEVYGDVPQREAEPGGEFEERPASEVNREAFAWLDGLDAGEDFFLWVHYFEPHLPYPPAEELPAAFRDRPYDGEVAAADAALGELLAHLEGLGRTQSTLVVVTSDHGESLGEHGELTHSFFVYQAVLRVPLILAHPSLPAGTVVQERVSLVDVAPTVLELLDVAPPTTAGPGRSLLDLIEGRAGAAPPVYFESLNPWLNYGWAPLHGVAHGDLKWIEAPRPELYDLAGDPDELRNLASERGVEAAELRELLRRLLAEQEDAGRNARARLQLDAEGRGKLAALGYTGAAAGPPEVATLADPKDGIERIRREDRARAQLAAGELDGAQLDLEALLEEDPQNPIFNAHLGLLWMQRGEHTRARGYLERSLAAGMDNPTNYSNVGVCFVLEGEAQKALTVLDEALRRNPKHLASLFWKARAHRELGQKVQARGALERILELWGGEEDATTEQVRRMLEELGD